MDAAEQYDQDMLATKRGALSELLVPHGRSDSPGLVMGVAMKQSIFRHAVGLASVQHGVANSVQTRMRIGSTSKHFASLAALLLAEEGRLDIDAPVDQVLPDLDFRKVKSAPTLRQFMNHTSGWRCGIDLVAMGSGIAVMPPGWIGQSAERQQEVNFAPGDSQLYCNTGYHLLSLAIDRAAGEPLESFLKTRVFDPIGMHDTEGVRNDLLVVPRLATLHVPAGLGVWERGMFFTEELRGEGNLVSTIDDMLRWLAHLRQPTKVGSAETWRQLLTTAKLNNGLRTVYALGLYRHLYRGVEVIHHAGTVIGGNCQMITVPAHDLDIVIMGNGLPISVQELARKVIDICLVDVLGPPERKADVKTFAHLCGQRYHGRSGMTIAFSELNGQLGLSFMNSPPMPLLRDEGSSLRCGFEDAAIGPLVLNTSDLGPTNDGKAPDALVVMDAGNAETLHRLPVDSIDAQEMGSALLGHWVSHDLAASAEVLMEDGLLVMRLRSDIGATRRLRITPFSSIAFGLHEVANPGARWMLSRDDSGGHLASRFRVSGLRARRLSFERAPGPQSPTA